MALTNLLKNVSGTLPTTTNPMLQKVAGTLPTTTNPMLQKVSGTIVPQNTTAMLEATKGKANAAALTPASNVTNTVVPQNTTAIMESYKGNARNGQLADTNIAPYKNMDAYMNAMAQAQQMADLESQIKDPTTWYQPATGGVDNGAGTGGGTNGGSVGGGVSAYEQAMLDAYNQRTALLQENLDNSLAQLLSGYNFNADALNRSADNALREAYINRMMNEKNLNQRLSMQGLNGGASESTIAGLLNNYGQSRNKIETERMGDLADLLNTYQNNVAKAQQSYNEALINAMPSYSNLISAQKAANAGTKSTSTSSKASANTSTAASAAQRVAGGEALSSVMDDLLAQTGGDYSAAMKILREAGLA